jgi:hypothetical protein
MSSVISNNFRAGKTNLSWNNATGSELGSGYYLCLGKTEGNFVTPGTLALPTADYPSVGLSALNSVLQNSFFCWPLEGT